jgi:hypothetical protein
MPEHLDRPQTKPRLKGSDAGAPGPAPNQTPTEGRSRTPRRRRDAADLVKTLANRGRPKKSSLSPRAAGGDDGRAWGGDGGSDAGGARTWTSRAEHLTRPQTKPRPKARAAHHAADLEDGPRKPGVAQRSPPSPPVRGRRGKREDPMPEHMDPAPNQPPTEGPSRTPRCQRCRRRRRRPHCSGSRSTHTSARAALRKRTDPDRAGARSGSADDPSFGRLVYAFGVVASAFAISAYR